MILLLVRLAALALLVQLLGTGCNSSEAPSAAIRIMPLGDSITQAARGRDSWRRELWFSLKDAGYEIDFVGGQSTNHWGAGAHSDFDPDHEGHWGWRADQVLDNIDGWAASHPPDVVLLHIGTNDIARGKSADTTVDEVHEVIASIRRQNPRVTVLLAQIIPVGSANANPRIREFNAALAVMAETMSTAESRIVVVNQFDGFNPAADTYDGLHPNEAGNQKMAARWFQALIGILPPPARRME